MAAKRAQSVGRTLAWPLGWGVLAWLMVTVLSGSDSSAQSKRNSFIGAQRCGACHEFEYQRWQQGPHGSAHQVLSEEQLGDAKCNACHTMVPPTETARTGANRKNELAGVQCESCHGAGLYYHPSYVMKDKELARILGLEPQSPAVCTRCHSEAAPSIRPFDYASMWERISHGPEAKRAWEQARAAEER